MKKAHIAIIKNGCVKFAANQGMAIKTLTDECFIAEDEFSIVDVPIDHLFDQFQQGHSFDDTLTNETNSKE